MVDKRNESESLQPLQKLIESSGSIARPVKRKRVVLFKGVEGYLSDVVQLTPGDHRIRVRVLSADGSYNESSSISGTFAPGSGKLLVIDFDNHNRRMRLALETEKHF